MTGWFHVGRCGVCSRSNSTPLSRQSLDPPVSVKCIMIGAEYNQFLSYLPNRIMDSSVQDKQEQHTYTINQVKIKWHVFLDWEARGIGSVHCVQWINKWPIEIDKGSSVHNDRVLVVSPDTRCTQKVNYYNLCIWERNTNIGISWSCYKLLSSALSSFRFFDYVPLVRPRRSTQWPTKRT